MSNGRLSAAGMQSPVEKNVVVPFRNVSGCSETLAKLRKALPASLAEALPALLSESPDPDAALLLFDRLIHETGESMIRQLERHPHLAHYALVVSGLSRYLGETLLQNPDLLLLFLDDRSLDRTLSREDFREALNRWRGKAAEENIQLLLARFKRREYVRIMLRDALGIAPLAETTAEISALADVLIEAALEEAQRRLALRFSHEANSGLGEFSVLALGKLGGNELNYSSDVDLLYIFGNGAASTGSFHREHYIRLAQQLTEILSSVTREGAVFRIDMRLRPQGSQGELAVSLAHALQYYATGAHDWERQALIKARHCAGDSRLSRAFLEGVQPHVYTKGVNLAAIETALQARERIRRRRPHFGSFGPHVETVDVKLDRGGIRDIEFLVQCLQRVYGGAEPWLRSGGTMFSLQKLHDKRHINSRDFQELNNTYVFLRHVEHRLQLRHGQQTHRLPASDEELRILQRSLEAASDQVRGDEFVDLIRQRMAAVAAIYHRIIQQQGRGHEAPDALYELQSVSSWTNADQSDEEILRRLSADSPALYAAALREDLSPHARKNLGRFLSSLWTGSERYAAVLRYPEAVPRALVIFQLSDYLSEILIRHPEEMATLATVPELQAPDSSGYLFDRGRGRVQCERDPVFSFIARSGLNDGEKLGLLRRHYRHRIFASGARDITEFCGVYESLAWTTAAAEDAVLAAWEIAGSPPDLAVLALGRLGSSEFDLLSDADVLFVCAENGDRVALTKAAEQIMQILAAYTRDGMVFPVDTRLRPHGREGDLLVTPAQLRAYCVQEAQPWEALTYTKLRLIAGSSLLGQHAATAVNALFQRCASDSSFADAVMEMRSKLEAAETEKSLKTSAGAIYDIDFLCSYLLVKNQTGDKQGALRDRLWRCAGSGLIPKSDAAFLDHAAEFLRTMDHVLRLVIGRANKLLPANALVWQRATEITSRILGREFPRGLEAELDDICSKVRQNYTRLLS